MLFNFNHYDKKKKKNLNPIFLIMEYLENCIYDYKSSTPINIGCLFKI
jgi:hypothetical protein